MLRQNHLAVFQLRMPEPQSEPYTVFGFGLKATLRLLIKKTFIRKVKEHVLKIKISSWASFLIFK